MKSVTYEEGQRKQQTVLIQTDLTGCDKNKFGLAKTIAFEASVNIALYQESSEITFVRTVKLMTA